MNRFPLLFFLFPLLQYNTANDFSVEIKLIAPFNREKVQFQVDVKNLSNTSARVLQHRIWDFKRNSKTSTGNYIVEFEKWAGSGYHLFEALENHIPSHDTNPPYIFLNQGASIRDTLTIHSSQFFKTLPQNFHPGLYRVRLSFNSVESGFAQVNNSSWVEFVLQ